MNMHLECAQCGAVRNEPFCPVCVVPRLQRQGSHYSPRFDGIDAVAKHEAAVASRLARARLKDGDTRDVVELLESEEL